LSILRTAAVDARTKSDFQGRRFFKLKEQRATTNTAPGNRVLEWRRIAAVAGEAVTVSVVEAAVPDRVNVEGEKLHDAPKGNPEQVNETAELKPFSGVTEMAAFPLCPAAKLIEAGEAAMEKSGSGVMV
jgi:hypothetical protein